MSAVSTSYTLFSTGSNAINSLPSMTAWAPCLAQAVSVMLPRPVALSATGHRSFAGDGSNPASLT